MIRGVLVLLHRVAARLKGRFLITLFVLVAGGAAFVLARRPAGAWTIDDSAISLSYADNISRGYGCVVYREGVRVEGFSNPLTVLCSVVLAWFGLLHPMVTHICLEAITFGALCAITWLWLTHVGTPKPVAVILTGVFAGLQLATPAIRIWYASGLENAQTSLAVALILLRLEQGLRKGFVPWLDGLIVFLIALIRPDSFLYPLAGFAALVVYPLLRSDDSPPMRAGFRDIALTVLVSASLILIALLFRRLYFGDWISNTYLAKVHGKPQFMVNLNQYVIRDLLPYAHTYVFLLLGFMMTAGNGAVRLSSLALPALFAAALGMPLLSGRDWMGEHRFGTAVITLSHLFFVLGLAALLSESWRKPLRARAYPCTAAALALLASIGLMWPQPLAYRRFIARAHATFENVVDAEGFMRLDVQTRLGLHYPSVVLPDAGGSHFIGGFQSVDHCLLTDFHLARTHRRPAEWSQYIYGERMPELVEAHHGPRKHGTYNKEYLLLASFQNPHSPNPAHKLPYYARRDVVECRSAGAGCEHISRAGSLEIWLSDRNVPFAVPAGVARIELLLGGVDQTVSDSFVLRLSVDGDNEESPPGLLIPGGERIIPSPGNLLRQAFLLHMPEKEGECEVRLDVFQAGHLVFNNTICRVAVDSQLRPTLLHEWMAKAEHLPLPQRAFLVAQARQQSKPRLSRKDLQLTLTAYREAARERQWKAAHLYDRIEGHYRAEILPAAKPVVRDLEERVVEQASLAARSLFQKADSGSIPEDSALMEVAVLVDRLRKLGFYGLWREPGIREGWSNFRENLWREKDIGRQYRYALGLAVIKPSDMAVQKALVDCRAAFTKSVRRPLPLPFVCVTSRRAAL